MGACAGHCFYFLFKKPRKKGKKGKIIAWYGGFTSCACFFALYNSLASRYSLENRRHNCYSIGCSCNDYEKERCQSSALFFLSKVKFCKIVAQDTGISRHFVSIRRTGV